jgi:hypothetical protein
MHSLTDRYVHAVVRRVPEALRPDVTAMIADMTEARTEAAHENEDAEAAAASADTGTTAEAAAGSAARVEVAVLEELGDPAALARAYSGSPQHLIGPDHFPTYRWVLAWVIPLALVVALTLNGLTYVVSTPDAHLGGLLGTAIGQSVPTVFIAFGAVTLLFAIIERSGPIAVARTGTSGSGEPGTSAPPPGTSARRRADASRRWTVDRLEDVAPGSSVRADAVVALIITGLLALIPLIPTTALYVGHLTDGETFINPELGLPWLIGYWVLLAAMAATAIWRISRPRLTTTRVAIDMVTDLAMAVFLTVALLTQDVIHPAIAAAGDLPVQLLTVVFIWAIVIWDQVATVRAYLSHLAAERRA